MVLKKAASGDIVDLFQGELLTSRLEQAKKTKIIDWLYTSKLYCVNNEAELRSFVDRALACPTPKAVDTETTGLLVGTDKLVGVSVAWVENDEPVSFYVPILSDVAKVNIPPHVTLSILKPLIEQPCVYYNFRFDYKFLRAVGITAKCLADVQVMKLFPLDGVDEAKFLKLKHGTLKDLFRQEFGLDMLNLEDILGKGVYSFALAPLELGKLYAATDAYATIKLYNAYLAKTEMTGVIYDMETRLLPIVAEIEYRGIKIDVDALNQAKEKVLEENKELQQKIYEIAGEQFNIGSPQQLGKILYEKLGLPVGVMTNEDGDTPSTDKHALAKLDHPIITYIVKYKKNQKLLTAFLGKLSSNLGSDGHIHTHLNPYGAVTGRFTSDHPNLQQIPKAKDDAENSAVLRKAFVADKGYYLLDFDYSMIEYRLLASMCKDQHLLKMFKDGVDVHAGTASILFGVPLDKVNKDLRNKGKTLNFGLIYGMGTISLANNLKCSEQEAEDMLNDYFKKIPGVLPWINKIKDEARKNKFVKTEYGRKRNLVNLYLNPHEKENRGKIGEDLRKAVNTKIQGTAADILKIAMIRLDKHLKDKDIHMVLQVHDELLFEVNENIPVSEAVELIKKCMELKIDGFVDIVADAAIGYSWGDVIDYEPGMTLDNIPLGSRMTIIGSPEILIKTGPELKKLFKNNKGECATFIRAGSTLMEPEDVDEETGEVTPVKVFPKRSLVSNIESLGLKVSFS